MMTEPDLSYEQLLEVKLASIRMYAIQHHLTAEQVGDYFSVGVAAQSILSTSQFVRSSSVH